MCPQGQHLVLSLRNSYSTFHMCQWEEDWSSHPEGQVTPHITVCLSAQPRYHCACASSPCLAQQLWFDTCCRGMAQPRDTQGALQNPQHVRQPSHRGRCCHLEHLGDKKCPTQSLLFQLANDKLTLCHSGGTSVVLCIVLLLGDHFYSTQRTELSASHI